MYFSSKVYQDICQFLSIRKRTDSEGKMKSEKSTKIR